MSHKFIVIGDLHVMPSNLNQTERWFENLVNFIKSRPNEAFTCVFLGDIFHTHAVVRQEVAHLMKKWVSILQEDCKVDCKFIVGNHDGVSPHSIDINAVRLIFDGHSVIDHLEPDANRVIHKDGYSLFLMSFFASPKEFVSEYNRLLTISNIPAGNKKILLCHQTFKGAVYENGMACHEPSVDPIELDVDLIISGHIHLSQTLGKVFYLGTPRPISWGEVNQPKHIGILGKDGLELISTKKWAPWYYELKVDALDKMNLDEAVSGVVDALNERDIDPNDDCVRLQVYTSDLELVEGLRGRLREALGDAAVKIRIVGNKVSASSKNVKDDFSLTKFSWEELLIRYIDRLNLKPHIKEEVTKRTIALWKRHN